MTSGTTKKHGTSKKVEKTQEEDLMNIKDSDHIKDT